MKQFWHLSLFQLKDKIDFSWVKSRKTLIQAIVFGVLKFAVVVAVAFGLLYLLTLIGFVNKYQDALPLFTIFLVVMFTLNVISSTYNLMKTLYFADDNKVLITFPVTANKLFFSKIFVYFVFELKKSLSILVPVILGFLIFEIIGYKGTEITIWSFFYMPIPVVIFVLIQVLLASILSIPFLYIYQFLKKNPIIELIGVIVLVGAGLLLVIRAISLIPEDIDLNIQWPAFVKSFEDFIVAVDKYIYPMNLFSRVFTGEFGGAGTHYAFNIWTFLKTLIAIGGAGLLGLIAFLLIRPFYFRMMNKTFEFDKNPNLAQKKNIRHKKYVTFANKEFKLSFRDFDISGSYLAIYIIVPILLFFMDKVISAISTSMRGDNIAIAVNLLLTILPLLASNSTIATLYSKEGRTAYITKSNPVNPFVPLTSKLLFNLIFCIPSIVGCAVIFGNFIASDATPVKIIIPIFFALSVLLLQYAHIFFCAAQDLMNPQNEAYATTGSDFNNPNETRATIAAFIASFIIAGLFYFMLTESMASIRLFILSAALFGGFLYLFIKKVQVFYYEK